MAVKAALSRGRAALRAAQVREDGRTFQQVELNRYAELFNAKDWDGLRALIGSDCKLDLVSKASRKGKEVGQYFGRYAKEDLECDHDDV